VGAARDAELATAASEHEALNRLRDRYRGEHDREAARRERNTLDEIATTRFRRSTV
jgi:flagellar export protein FliJ